MAFIGYLWFELFNMQEVVLITIVNKSFRVLLLDKFRNV
jgi:hypothetical protein